MPIDPPAPPNPSPSGSSSNSNTDNNEISAQLSAALKLPQFWSSRPDLWFIQVETQFRMKGITSSNTKYDYLISSMTSETMELVADAIMNPPVDNKYEYLKQLLLTRSQDTEEKRLDALLNRVDLGDLIPSELYRRMESLAGDKKLVNKQLLYKLWLNKLPTNIQPCIIALESTQDQKDLFMVADKIYHATDRPRIAAVDQNSMSNHSNTMADALCEISKRLERLENGQSRRDRSRSRSANLPRARSSSRKKYDTCWYHHRYGDKAQKCIAPCKMSKPSNQSNDRNFSKN